LSEETGRGGLRARGEEALTDLAQALFENGLLSQALGTAVGAGERAARAQRNALTALNLPSAADLERVERRLRGMSERLDDLEDRLDEMEDEIAAGRQGAGAGAASMGRDQDPLAVSGDAES
jgi:chromosome segregation ATPase